MVRLAAAGLTNPAIGERLFISRGTVKTHLLHVFAKLGAVSRIDAVNKAIAGSLIESPHDQLEPSQGSARSHRVL